MILAAKTGITVRKKQWLMHGDALPYPGLCISLAVSGGFLADFAWKFFVSIVHAVHLAQVFLNNWKLRTFKGSWRNFIISRYQVFSLEPGLFILLFIFSSRSFSSKSRYFFQLTAGSPLQAAHQQRPGRAFRKAARMDRTFGSDMYHLFII